MNHAFHVAILNVAGATAINTCMAKVAARRRMMFSVSMVARNAMTGMTEGRI